MITACFLYNRRMKKHLKFGIVQQKLLYTILIMLIYLIGRSIPLYGVDVAAYENAKADTGSILLQAVGGDAYHYSIFTLGVSPFMLSTILIQIFMAFRDADARAQVSPKKKAFWTIFLMMIIAVFQAMVRAEGLHFLPFSPGALTIVKGICTIQMVTGAVLILQLSERNRKYGFGGQTALILVNIIDGLTTSMAGYSLQTLALPLFISLIVMIVIIIMENMEHRSVIQRIAVVNQFADKNYLAIKGNPIGIMPVMFASSFFLIPQMLGSLFNAIAPGADWVIRYQESMRLTNPVGVLVYCIILFALSIIFPLIFVNPSDMEEQLLKNGDSLAGVHAGKDTKKYVRHVVLAMSIFSAIIMTACVAAPLSLQFYGMEPGLIMLPSSIMMLTGIFCGFYQEIVAVKRFDSYERFL